MTLKQLSVAIVLAGSLAGCDQAPSPSPPGPAPQHYTLSGVVSEMTPTGSAPLAGVLVQETTSSRRARTDDQGRYVIAGVL